ncbi:QueT transporter family protein [uncultured Gemmiger sp.]|uniref:QueT transporter family protein n=1 Tax=uncultured Gemmiger sp. TaxID=1623490 RepID=UPI0025969DA8|nr:QueT transporter family protein [uncultured Gemmiger sp.]
MNMKNLSVRRLVRCAVIAAVYVVVCLVLAPFSYGAVQVRVAEALCLLPVFGAEYIVGVTLGCFLANLLGSTVVDVVFGTLATLLACLVTYKLRDVRVKGLAIPASLPPVVFNMIIVGAFEITFFFSDGAPTAMLAVFNAVTVGIGELISCTILGVALVKLIESNAGMNKIFTEE